MSSDLYNYSSKERVSILQSVSTLIVLAWTLYIFLYRVPTVGYHYYTALIPLLLFGGICLFELVGRLTFRKEFSICIDHENLKLMVNKKVVELTLLSDIEGVVFSTEDNDLGLIHKDGDYKMLQAEYLGDIHLIIKAMQTANPSIIFKGK